MSKWLFATKPGIPGLWHTMTPHFTFRLLTVFAALAALPIRQPVTAVEPLRSWVVEQPQFKTLLSDQSAGLRRQGALMWQHLLDVPVGHATAVRWGVRYVSEEMYRIHGELQFKLISSGPDRTDDLALAKKYQLRTVPECPRQIRLPNGDYLHILHPDSLRHYFAGVENFLDHPAAGLMWGLFAGDEDDDVAVYRAAMLKRQPVGHDYIHDLNRQVREEFGGGKWGIPAGIKDHDPNPYRWIALYRYVAARLRDRQRQLYQMVKRRAPQLVVTSFDSPGGIYPTEWSELAPFADLFTLQMGYPGGSSRWRATAGFHSKVVSDLTGKDFWPCTHFEHYDYPDSKPAEVLEEVSQIFRNGGTGLHLYLPDTLNISKATGDLRTTYFSSPRRYHTVMNIARFIRSMPQLRLPNYQKTAIVYNDDTIASRPHDNPDLYGQVTQACYTFLGPVATSWFRFIDSGQIARWPTLRDRFDIIYLPAAKYQRPEITVKLHRFVKAGGTLICSDPEAFQTDLWGNDTSHWRTATFGVTVKPAPRPVHIQPSPPAPAKRLPVHGPAYRFTPQKPVKVLAIFDDGTPAITSHKLGRGRAVLFASHLFWPTHVAEPAWRNFFQWFVARMGTPAGFDIWNFKLPETLIWHAPPQKGVCLTNNRVVWRDDRPWFEQNLDSGGSYRYSRPPDTLRADLPDNQIPFSQGRLTDRHQAIHAEKRTARPYEDYQLPETHWIASWSDPRPVTITFDLQQPRALSEVKVWFRTCLAALTCAGSLDGRTWHRLAQATAQRGASGDVYDKSIALRQGPRSRYLRMQFAGRTAGETLTLSEVEIWAAEPAEKPR